MLSKKGKDWLDKALTFLQTYMEDEIDKRNKIEYNDDDFTEMAFDTHPKAYWNAGFHKLSFLDKIFVSATPDIEEWGHWNTWKQAFKMGANEAAEYGLNPNDILDDSIEGMDDIRKLLNGDGPIDRLEKEPAPCQR